MKLYQENGYIDVEGILQRKLPFNFVVGGRGSGKTYTALLQAVLDKRTFIYLRRTQSQCDLINKMEFSPFKAINRDQHWNIQAKPISKYNAGFYEVDESGETDPVLIGYTAALSTISNLRGFDASDVSLIIYDEFIPEHHERPIKNEGSAFLNMYETINRNRELTGGKAVQVLALANANDMANEIFITLKLVQKAEKMAENKTEILVDQQRGIGIYMLEYSPISAEKQQTALYRLMEDSSEFSQMAVHNAFSLDNIDRIGSRNLREFQAVVQVGELTIYRHKSKNEFYVTEHASGNPRSYGIGDIELKRFQISYAYLWQRYYDKKVIFETYPDQILFEKYFGF